MTKAPEGIRSLDGKSMTPIARIRQLREECGYLGHAWVFSYLATYTEHAVKRGYSRVEILEAMGLAEAFKGVPQASTPEMDALLNAWETAGRHRTEGDNLQLRDLAEMVLEDTGATKADIARVLSASSGTVRNILNPYYSMQTPEERSAYWADRDKARANRAWTTPLPQRREPEPGLGPLAEDDLDPEDLDLLG